MRSLQQKKFRNETGLFLAEGRKLVEEALRSDFKIHSVYTTDADWKPGDSLVQLITRREMDTISSLTAAAGYIAAIYQPEYKVLRSNGNCVLVLDGINDPGNLGTMIRTADWFGIKMILCTTDTVDAFNPKVIQGTMGSIFNTQIHYQSAPSVVKWCEEEGYAMVGADLQGADLFRMSMPKKMALVIGSESHGIRPEIRNSVKHFVHIPGSGKAESLNAGVAAAVIVSQWFNLNR